METLTYPKIRLVQTGASYPCPYPYLLESDRCFWVNEVNRVGYAPVYSLYITMMWCNETQLAQSKIRYNLYDEHYSCNACRYVCDK